MMKFSGKFIADLFGLLFPRLCGGCGRQLNNGEKAICTHCLYHIPYTDHHLHKDNKVARHFWGKIPVSNAMALCYYQKGNGVQQLIYSLKYRGRQEIGTKIGMLIAEKMLQGGMDTGIDLLIAVPLHQSKERKRGYNQSSSIASGIAGVLKLPVAERLLLRAANTESQTRKGRDNRHQNMQEAFRVPHPQALSGKHILLVDDVVTTGATLEACAIELFRSGVKEISIAVAACAD